MEWRDVVGYEGFYQVSNTGMVRSVDRRVIQHHRSTQLKRGRVLRSCTSRLGYLIVALSRLNKLRSFSVHRLVAFAFVPNPHGYKEINHIDAVKANNHADNLEWCTRSQNLTHAESLSLIPHPKGDAHHKTIIKQKQHPVIKMRYFDYSHKVADIAKDYGVCTHVIYRILNITNTYQSMLKTKKP